MKSAKRIWKFFFWPLVAFIFFRQIDDIGKFHMEDAVMLWPGWAIVATYWHIPLCVYGLVCLIYGSIKAYGWFKLRMFKMAMETLKAAQTATANANQPGAGNPAPIDPLAQPAQPAPTTPPTPPEKEANVVPTSWWYVSLALNAVVIAGLSFMVYIYIDQLAKNSELMEANYSVESKIIKKQQEIAQQFGVPLPPMTTEADVMKADAKQLFLGGGCDFFNVQLPDKKQEYRELVKGTRAARSCMIDGNTVPDETAENYSIEEPTEPEPTVTPPVTKPKTKPAAPATSAQVYKPAVKSDTRTGTGRPTYGSSYVPPTANVQYGEYQGTPSSANENPQPAGQNLHLRMGQPSQSAQQEQTLHLKMGDTNQ